MTKIIFDYDNIIPITEKEMYSYTIDYHALLIRSPDIGDLLEVSKLDMGEHICFDLSLSSFDSYDTGRITYGFFNNDSFYTSSIVPLGVTIATFVVASDSRIDNQFPNYSMDNLIIDMPSKSLVIDEEFFPINDIKFDIVYNLRSVLELFIHHKLLEIRP